MSFHPPGTEKAQDSGKNDAYDQTIGSPGVFVQSQSKAVIQKRTDD